MLHAHTHISMHVTFPWQALTFVLPVFVDAFVPQSCRPNCYFADSPNETLHPAGGIRPGTLNLKSISPERQRLGKCHRQVALSPTMPQGSTPTGCACRNKPWQSMPQQFRIPHLPTKAAQEGCRRYKAALGCNEWLCTAQVQSCSQLFVRYFVERGSTNDLFPRSSTQGFCILSPLPQALLNRRSPKASL